MSEAEGCRSNQLDSTGVKGLDAILNGGVPHGRLYLLVGPPGTGKTTLAMQFLREGVRRGESVVYVTLSETEEELADIARSHGWTLDDINICDLQTSDELLSAERQYTLFHPSDIELTDTTRAVLDVAEKAKPTRIVFDSMSEMRLLAKDSLRFRRQILALKHYFSARGTTVLLVDTQSSEDGYELASIAHGVVELTVESPQYGGQRRQLRVHKVRGLAFFEGFHEYAIERGGLNVSPRLSAAAFDRKTSYEQVSSGIAELDELSKGGLESGSSALFLGAAGVGKSTIAMQYARAAAERGQCASVYLFDERAAAWRERAQGLGMDLGGVIDTGRIRLEQVDPAQLGPGQFAHRVRADVEDRGPRVVVIDSINGYMMATPEARHLTLHLHELLTYLSQRDVLTLMVMAQRGLLGEHVDAPLELSYLADTVFLLRYFEAYGQVRQAISVIKKRIGDHDRRVRELRLGPPKGLRIGEELVEFTGVLTGHPEFRGTAPDLMEGKSS